MMKNLIVAVFLLPLWSCRPAEDTPEQTEISVTTAVAPIPYEDTANKVNYDDVKILKTVLVIDRSGAEMRQQPYENSKVVGRYNYGAKLDVIEEGNLWLGVLERITRSFVENGDSVISTSWEKIYVLKNKVGDQNKIALAEDDLNIISSFRAGGNSEYFEKDRRLTSYLKMEFIDKSLFESRRKTAVNLLLADTNAIQKRGAVLELPCLEKTVVYKDIPDTTDLAQTFTYKGQIPFLNQYLVKGNYYEGSDYKFVDKTTGIDTFSFCEYPFISPDKKHLLCIYANPYESTGDLELYSIINGRIKFVMSTSFNKWMPAGDTKDIFWSSDGYLYTAVNHVASFWTVDGNTNNKYQYIRIKML